MTLFKCFGKVTRNLALDRLRKNVASKRGFGQTAIAFEVSLFVMMVRYGLYRLRHKGQKCMRIALAPPLAMGCLITLAGQYIMAIF